MNEWISDVWWKPANQTLTSLSAAMAPLTSSRSVIGRCRRFISPSTNEKISFMPADAWRLSAAPKARFQRWHSWVSANFSCSVLNTTEPTVQNTGSSEICTSSVCRDGKTSWVNEFYVSTQVLMVKYTFSRARLKPFSDLHLFMLIWWFFNTSASLSEEVLESLFYQSTSVTVGLKRLCFTFKSTDYRQAAGETCRERNVSPPPSTYTHLLSQSVKVV